MRPISYSTYKQYAKQYKIKLSEFKNNKRKLKNIQQLSHEIYKYESDNVKNIKTDMLYYY